MKPKQLFATLGLLGLLLAGCQPSGNISATLPAVVQTKNTPTSPSNPLPTHPGGVCANLDMNAWADSLPYPEAVLTEQSYRGQRSLVLWYADPGLTEATPEELETLAAESALSTLKQLMQAQACFASFESVYVTVVDAGYQLRFSGSVRTEDLAQLSNTDLDDGSGEVGSGRLSPTAEESASGAGQSCLWTDVSTPLSESFSSDLLPAAFTLTRDPVGTHLSAYVTVPHSPDREATQQIAEAVYSSTGCLQTTLTDITLTLTLPNSQLVVTAYQPLSGENGPDPEAFRYTRFDPQ